MGCLKVNINPVGGLENVSVVSGGDLKFSVTITKEKIRRCLRAVFNCLNDLFISSSVVNDSFSVSAEFACSQPKIDIGVICMANLDTECYLQVLDGFLITIDGCFVKVTKE